MKEIDTEAPVVWPAWCYSGNIPTDVLKQSPRAATISSSSSSSSSLSSSSDVTSPRPSSCNPEVVSSTAPPPTTNDIDRKGVVVGVAHKLRTKRKSHFTTKQLPKQSVDDNSINGQNYPIVVEAKEQESPSSARLYPSQGTTTVDVVVDQQQIKSRIGNTTLYAEKMLSDRMLLSGYNAIESSKKLCDSSSAYLFLEKVKNETQMESLKDSESTNNNNVNSSSNNISNNNNNNNSSSNNNNFSSNNPSGNSNTNNVISNNNSNSNSNASNNSVKRERLSPGTNGDGQFALSRSRSATPSSFRGTPPQTTHTNNDIQLHNLSSNLLSQIQGRSSDFSTRNYSDFMRSLAAKYNNSNPNDSGSSRRSTFFENSKVNQANKSAANNCNNSSSSLKDQPSPSESAKSSAQNVQNLTTNTPTVPPFVQNFLSSLPFSPGVFPPLIDMSSTQALVTLARAAKEAEIKNILMSAQKRSSLSNNTASRSPGPNLTAALQQAAQFASPALLYSAQLQQQQSQQTRHSSPIRETSANNSGEKHMTASPLDLSSAPPAKRYKAESLSSGSSERCPSRENVPPGATTSETVQTPAKSPKVNAPTTPEKSEAPASAAVTTPSVIPLRQCQAQSEEVNAWSVEDVCTFVGSIDICAEYIQNFRDQCIDGSGLPLLTEDHLMNSLGMKLGPALKLKSMLAKKLGGPCPCVSCSSQAQLLAAAQAAAVATSATTSVASSSSPPSVIGNNQLHPQQQLNIVRNPAATCNSSSSSQTMVHGSTNSSSSIPRPGSADSGS